jgi:hypothetical protein
MLMCAVLISANDQKFTYAGIFCGLTAVIGTGIAIMPRVVEILSRRRGIEDKDQEK